MMNVEKPELIPAVPADLDEIWAMCVQVRLRTPTAGWSDEYPTRGLIAADLASGELYKVLDGARIISIMKIRSWADFMAGEEEPDIDGWDPAIHNPCALGRFCVDPDYQGQGLGRRIMLATLDKAKALGYDGAQFHAVTSNPVCNHLYESMGFHKAGHLCEYGTEFYCYDMKL